MRFKLEYHCHECGEPLDQDEPVIADCGFYYHTSCYRHHEDEVDMELGVDSVVMMCQD
jgi:hypothetical protein